MFQYRARADVVVVRRMKDNCSIVYTSAVAFGMLNAKAGPNIIIDKFKVCVLKLEVVVKKDVRSSNVAT